MRGSIFSNKSKFLFQCKGSLGGLEDYIIIVGLLRYIIGYQERMFEGKRAAQVTRQITLSKSTFPSYPLLR